MAFPSKDLKTLPEDIYKVLEDGTLSDLDTDSLAHNLSSILRREIGKEDRKPYLRMSNFGTKCERKLWYSINKPELGEKIDGKALFKFLYGHILEAVTLWLAKLAGRRVEGEQDEMDLHGVKGHRDAVVDGVLVDVKTANSRGFDKFKNHELEKNDPFGYLDQLGMYLEASRNDSKVEVKREAAFIAVDKEMGNIVVDSYKFPDKDYAKFIEDKRNMLSSTSPPARYYAPEPEGSSGNLVIPMECRYCAWKKPCWADSNNGRGLLKYLYSTGPKWFIRIIKEPRVPFVND